MFQFVPDPDALSRRRFLALGGSAAAAATLLPLVDPLAALGATRWPSGKLTAKDAVKVRPSQFMPSSQFTSWLAAADKLGPANQRGLRATGSAAELTHQNRLRKDLVRAGVKDVGFDAITLQRWTTDTWGLDVNGAPVTTASYIPYSGQTPAAGVSGELVYLADPKAVAPGSLTGKIAVYDVPVTSIPLSFFLGLTYPGKQYDPGKQLSGSDPYRRPYLEQGVAILDALQESGAVGIVAVIDFPEASAKGTYFPYDGVLRKVPGVYVDRAVGATLKEQAKAGGVPATVKLPAQVASAKARNLLGVIPGRSKECVVLHCHTDGSNAIEDNGPDVIVAMAQYLSRLPKSALPRTIVILLNTGHFHGGLGAQDFLKRHDDDFAKRANAALTIEHVGLKEWNEVSPGTMAFTGKNEPGAMFGPNSKALVDRGYAGLQAGKMNPSGVLKPLNPTAKGTPDNAVWPGEGQYLQAVGGIPTLNFITGPTYLLNWGITTADKVDQARVRRQAIGFTELILALGRTKRSALRAKDLKA